MISRALPWTEERWIANGSPARARRVRDESASPDAWEELVQSCLAASTGGTSVSFPEGPCNGLCNSCHEVSRSVIAAIDWTDQPCTLRMPGLELLRLPIGSAHELRPADVAPKKQVWSGRSCGNVVHERTLYSLALREGRYLALGAYNCPEMIVCPECGRQIQPRGWGRHVGSRVCMATQSEDALRARGWVHAGHLRAMAHHCDVPSIRAWGLISAGEYVRGRNVLWIEGWVADVLRFAGSSSRAREILAMGRERAGRVVALQALRRRRA